MSQVWSLFSSQKKKKKKKRKKEIWLYSGITDQCRPQALKFSISFPLEFVAKSVNERDRNTHIERERDVCVTLLIE